MHFKEILSRLTGISIPVFGVQWNPPEADRSVARRVIAFLEDRRVLYVPSEMEVPGHCVESVLRIREFLSTEIGTLAQGGALCASLRAMRSACRKFLAVVEADKREGRPIIMHANELGHYASWVFNGALGELRGVFGIHIAALAAGYGLDVEDDLASILPAPDSSDPEDVAERS